MSKMERESGFFRVTMNDGGTISIHTYKHPDGWTASASITSTEHTAETWAIKSLPGILRRVAEAIEGIE